MTYLTLYRKWRPQTFSDVIGQKHITDTISRAIDTNRLSHAYLFTGPRGTGKTTTARILAKAVNCVNGPTSTPCLVCDSCKGIASGNYLDLLEIDAASHRRVEETRGLLETIPLSPAHGRKKVYIIDEVHMLTTESFNTLLKTLEEPPDHILFVLATTDPQSVLPTIHSRCQRFDFRAVGGKTLAAHLGAIAEAEGIHIEEAALLQIARAHGGSVRDAVGTLEQLWMFCPGGITSSDVAMVLGTTEYNLLFEVVDILEQQGNLELIRFMRRLTSSGTDLRHFVHDLCRHYRDLLLLAENPDADDLIDSAAEHLKELRRQSAVMSPYRALRCARQLQQAELDLRFAGDPGLFIEVTLLGLAKVAEATITAPASTVTVADNIATNIATAAANVQAPPRTTSPATSAPASAAVPTKAAPAASKPVSSSPPPSSAPAPKAAPPRADLSEPVLNLAELQAVWPQVLELLKQMSKGSTAAYLRQARLLSFESGVVTVGFQFENHMRRMEAADNKDPLVKVLSERILGSQCHVAFVVDHEVHPVSGGNHDLLIGEAHVAAEKAEPAVEKAAPAVEQAVPAVDRRMPAAEKPIPAVEKTAPSPVSHSKDEASLPDAAESLVKLAMKEFNAAPADNIQIIEND